MKSILIPGNDQVVRDCICASCRVHFHSEELKVHAPSGMELCEKCLLEYLKIDLEFAETPEHELSITQALHEGSWPVFYDTLQFEGHTIIRRGREIEWFDNEYLEGGFTDSIPDAKRLIIQSINNKAEAVFERSCNGEAWSGGFADNH